MEIDDAKGLFGKGMEFLLKKVIDGFEICVLDKILRVSLSETINK